MWYGSWKIFLSSCIEVSHWCLCLFIVLACIINRSALFLFVSLATVLWGFLHLFPKWFMHLHLEQLFSIARPLCSSCLVFEYLQLCWCLLSLYCKGFCYNGLLSLLQQIFYFLWWYLVLISVPLTLPPFCSN